MDKLITFKQWFYRRFGKAFSTHYNEFTAEDVQEAFQVGRTYQRAKGVTMTAEYFKSRNKKMEDIVENNN